jgi:hypothetical protein
MDQIKDEIKKLIGLHLKELRSEIEKYFVMISDIYDPNVKVMLNLSPNMILYKFNLKFEDLDDPYRLPELLLLAEYMKENNYNYFSRGWNTQGYFHHDHAFQLKKLISVLQSYSKLIENSRLKQLESLLHTNNVGKTKDPVFLKEKIIKSNFNDFNLPEFEDFILLINNAAKNYQFYKIVPLLLRCLFENLLYFIFRDGLSKAHTDLYFNTKKNRIRDFSTLISLLNYVKDHELKPFFEIDQKIIDFLGKIREDGNYSVHKIFKLIDKNYIDNIKEQLSIFMKPLLSLYKAIKGRKIEINDGKRLNKIIEDLGIKNLKKRPIKEQEDNSILEQRILGKIYNSVKEDDFDQLYDIFLSEMNERVQRKIIRILKLRIVKDSAYDLELTGKQFNLYFSMGQLENYYRDNIQEGKYGEDNKSNNEIKTRFLEFIKKSCLREFPRLKKENSIKSIKLKDLDHFLGNFIRYIEKNEFKKMYDLMNTPKKINVLVENTPLQKYTSRHKIYSSLDIVEIGINSYNIIARSKYIQITDRVLQNNKTWKSDEPEKNEIIKKKCLELLNRYNENL